MMKERNRYYLCRLIICAALASSAGGIAWAASSPTNWVTAISAPETPQISGFASAQPNGLMTISPSQAGMINGIDVFPGQSVASGQVIATLGGPQITAATIEAEAAVRSAHAVQHAAEISVRTEEQKLQQRLSTHQLVAQAEAALISAKEQTATDTAKLAALQQSASLRSSLAGVVQTVAVSGGDVVATGQTVATILPSSGIWLKAVFYNATVTDLLSGTTGLFTPSNGGPSIPVIVRSGFGTTQADGGMPVALVPAAPVAPGAFGTVTLNLPARTVTLVPTEALIMDKGQWWVMLHTAQGDQPMQIVPGPAQGYDTVINSGVKLGDEVVVVNAYLLYHRGIAALYQPPD
jgi:multidrug efflux pump subunit AcrA (membrane-fusion protein)